MTGIDYFIIIIRDMHVANRHKKETKTHKNIMKHYSNISMAIVKTFIANCERCAEKS